MGEVHDHWLSIGTSVSFMVTCFRHLGYFIFRCKKNRAHEFSLLQNNEYPNILHVLIFGAIEIILVGLSDVSSIASKIGALGTPVDHSVTVTNQG